MIIGNNSVTCMCNGGDRQKQLYAREKMSKSKNSERFEKRFRIGVRFDGSRFVRLDGRPLPELTAGSIAELVVSPEALMNPADRAALESLISVPLLPGGATVMVGVSPSMVEVEQTESLITAELLSTIAEFVFLPVRLESPLNLQVRGDQESSLASCSCTIPSLGQHAQSLNHAFTLVSEAYETKRRSHSGNVFQRVYATWNRGPWKPLDDLRHEAIQKLAADSASRPAQ